MWGALGGVHRTFTLEKVGEPCGVGGMINVLFINALVN